MSISVSTRNLQTNFYIFLLLKQLGYGILNRSKIFLKGALVLNVKLIDEHCGFDGSAYFCAKCGKTGYRNPSGVYGHLRFCKGVTPAFDSAFTPTPISAFYGEATPTPTPTPTPALSSVDGRVWAEMQNLSQRMGKLEKAVYNEMPHQMAVAQAQRQLFDDFKWAKWIAIAVVAVWLLRKLGDADVVKKAGNKIGDRVLGKAIDGLLGL
jgi:hypothetical protein